MAGSRYNHAAGKGYPYLRGDGVWVDGVWVCRFTRDYFGREGELFVGYDSRRKDYVTYTRAELNAAQEAQGD